MFPVREPHPRPAACSRRLDRCDRVIQSEAKYPFGGNVYYITMQITLFTRIFRNALYSEQQSAVRTDSGTTHWFSVSKGVRQGCIMSPQLFSVYTESIMREVEEEQNNTEYDELSVGGTTITELRYADDTAVCSIVYNT